MAPAGAVPLHVHEQYGAVVVWALVDLDQPVTALKLYVIGTGHVIPDDADRYLGTAHVHGFVWHIFTVRG